MFELEPTTSITGDVIGAGVVGQPIGRAVQVEPELLELRLARNGVLLARDIVLDLQDAEREHDRNGNLENAGRVEVRQAFWR